jgi:hypothetical protein
MSEKYLKMVDALEVVIGTMVYRYDDENGDGWFFVTDITDQKVHIAQGKIQRQITRFGEFFVPNYDVEVPMTRDSQEDSQELNIYYTTPTGTKVSKHSYPNMDEAMPIVRTLQSLGGVLDITVKNPFTQRVFLKWDPQFKTRRFD